MIIDTKAIHSVFFNAVRKRSRLPKTASQWKS